MSIYVNRVLIVRPSKLLRGPISDRSRDEIGFRGLHTPPVLPISSYRTSSFCAISKRMKSQNATYDDDLAYIENRMSRCTSTYMSASSHNISGRYLLNSGLCTT